MNSPAQIRRLKVMRVAAIVGIVLTVPFALWFARNNILDMAVVFAIPGALFGWTLYVVMGRLGSGQ